MPQTLFQALGLHIEQDRRSVFTLFLNSGFLGNATALQDPDPDWAVELSRWKWQQEVKWVVLVGKGQEGLDWTRERIYSKTERRVEVENLTHAPSEN